MNFEIPADNRKQNLVYKAVGERKISLTFLPPTVSIYEYAPVYFLIPGGGWHMEKRSDMLDFAQISVNSLRESGFAVVSIDYRVSEEDGIAMEEIISDCFDAARYLSHFRETLKIDSDRIAVSGHSAGGHLALMLAYAPHDMFVRDSFLTDDFTIVAAAPLSPPTILYTTDEEPTLGIQTDKAFKNCNTEEMRRKCSPYSYVSEQSPATILCAGTSDRLVYCNSSELLYKKLTENHVHCKLILSVCGGHCFEQMHDGIIPVPPYVEIQKNIVNFVKDNI